MSQSWTTVDPNQCGVLTEADWIPVMLTPNHVSLASQLGERQYEQSRAMKLRDRSVHSTDQQDFEHQVWSKLSEFAVYQWAGCKARITQPGEFHDYPDVGRVNVRHMMDPEDSLLIQVRDQGSVPMVLTTTKDGTFADRTIWLVGWGIPDQMRRVFYSINQFRNVKSWGRADWFEPHEQLLWPRGWLNPMATLSKDYINGE